MMKFKEFVITPPDTGDLQLNAHSNKDEQALIPN